MYGYRPRISLLSALVGMTIIGMVIVIVQLWHEVEPLRSEVDRLRQELGYLSVHDPQKIYAIRVPTNEAGVHRYRIYLPTDRRFKIHTRIGTIPGRLPQQTKQEWFETLDGSGSTSEIDSGEFTIDIAVRPDSEKPDHWSLSHQVAGRGGGSVGTKMSWLNDRRVWSVSGEPVIGKQIEADSDDGLVLYALRKASIKEFPGGYSMYPPNDGAETPGLMIWISPVSAND